MKALLTLWLLLISSQIFSADSSICSSLSEANLKKCLAEVMTSVKYAGVAPHTCTANESGDVHCPPLASKFSNDGATCESFISSNGTRGYGPWGKEIINYLSEKGTNSQFFKSDLAGMDTGVMACPNWKNLNLDEKKHFWVWTMASIANVESKCNPKARNLNGTNGVAAGLLQLEERTSMRSWRGKNCEAKNISEARANIRCGLDILGNLLEGKAGVYKTNGELWGPRSNSYWQHLRQKNGGGIADLIRLHPACRASRLR